MDMYTSGTSRNAKTPNTAEATARRSASPMSVRSSRKDMYSSQSTNVEVNRASQVHQMPHTGRAQMGPVTKTTVLNTTPTSAAETPSQSQRISRLKRYKRLAMKQMKNARNAVIPLVAWK